MLEGEVAEAAEEILKRKLYHLFPQLKGWCPDHLWVPSCYHKTFEKSFINKLLEKV
jgi:hypothetical protein